MRILHFLPVYIPAWQFGGPILSVSRLCEGLVQQGIDVRVITTTAGLPHFPLDQLGLPQNVNGVEVFYYPVNSPRRTIRSNALIQALPEHLHWAELLHLSSIWQPLGLVVQQQAHRHHLPVIQSLRGALGPYSLKRGWYKKIPYLFFKELPLLNKALSLHCTTPREASECTWLGIKSKTDILPNPLDLTQFYCDSSIGKHWLEENNIPSNQTLFIIAGRLHHKKGLDLLPPVLSSIRDEPWRLIVIGNDEDGTGKRLLAGLQKLGIADRCHWFSAMPSSELLGPLNAADWLLLPSRHENFGNIVVEALSCGCGTLLSDHVGAAQMLDGCPGVAEQPRNTALWSKMLLRAVRSERPGRQSEAYVKTRFSLEVVASKAIILYKGILNEQN